MIRGELLSDAADLDRIAGDWAALAVSNARPYCSPEWMLQWWANVAPAGARLRVATVSDGGGLVAVAPLYADATRRGNVRYRLLGAGTFLRGDVLAVAGRDREIAQAIAAALRLATDGPAVLALEGVAAGSPWPRLLRDEWPRPNVSRLFREWSVDAPVLSRRALSFEEWFSRKSSNFRQQMRRARSHLEKKGAVFRMSATEDELRSDLRAFVSLHRARWAERGGSSVLSAPVEAMLFEAGRRMLDGRFRLWSLEVEGQVVSSHLFLAAGGEVAYWLGGFDEGWAPHKPSLLVLLAALEDAWTRGDNRFDLGGGGQDYKYRFADDTERLDWVTVIPPGWRRPVTQLSLATVRARRTALSKLTPRTQARLRALVGRR
jgi:CelD/BcsL family acetyltransferase involved in cellulose biosynthesis